MRKPIVIFNPTNLLLNLLLGLVLSIAIASTSSTSAQQDYLPVPPEAEACVELDSPVLGGDGGAEVLATEVVDGTQYFLIFTYHKEDWEDREFPSALLVSASQGTCESLFWNTPGALLPYADYVPMAAAVNFRQIEFERQIALLGGNQDQFINSFDLDEQPLFEEESLALEQMGILDELEEAD